MRQTRLDSRPPSPAGPTASAGGRSSWDEAVHAIAASQHGLITRRQLTDAGLTVSAIRHRVARQRLHRIHPGVYAVGHRLLSVRGWWMAAVLSGGDGALLSHRAAAALWGLVDGTPAIVDVLVQRGVDGRSGVRTHRARTIREEDRALVDGIPCTSLARTLVDLAATAGPRTIDRALRRASDRRLFDRFAVEAILERGRPGTTVLRSALGVFAGDESTRRRLKSELEVRFIELLRRHGFVLPSTNVVIETPWSRWEVDTLWPAQRLVIELDGWRSHHDRESFRRDHRRATDLRAVGYDVTRLGWEQVVEQETATVDRLARFVPEVGASPAPERSLSRPR